MTFKSPVYDIKKVPIRDIEANDYNPNKTANREMRLLYQSIKEDGYTMPIVCYFDKERGKYIIVDGFHRYLVMKTHKDIFKREGGCLPVSVIDKDLNNRMASTIRHNRARGKHDIELQAELLKMLKSGWSNQEIIKQLGMTAEELLRMLGVARIETEARAFEYSNETLIVECKS